ncbi:DUF6733 family protein [Aquimarina algicola]|uniref:Ion channel protein Tsx n=1 Tax=Aquimarina algicola TaxID=2589995 RepID=A0A504JF90_9FLAO|nr:DUF6733 family protein [Aquimarina algicola]TPN86293.1 hypothetical protein FHK87_13585 [Aquimarina algicola]
MKKIFTTIALVAILSSGFAQDDTANTEDKLSFGLSLNLDAFFGFNPMMTGAYELSETGSITAYGIQWGAGTGSDWGQWTEVGLGYNFTTGNFDINPQLGFTMGSLLSSGANQEGIIGDGIVPNLTVNYGSDKFEGQFYFGYYLALRDNTEAGEATNNYVHYWANLGHKVSSVFSFGAHFEQLFLSGGDVNGGDDLDRADGYLWIGPYVQLQKKGTGLRFSGGWNAEDSEAFSQNDFYKLTFFTSL